MRSRRNSTGYLEFCWISRSPRPKVSLKRSIRTGPRLLLEWHSPPFWQVSINAARAEKKARDNFYHNNASCIHCILIYRIQDALRNKELQLPSNVHSSSWTTGNQEEAERAHIQMKLQAIEQEPNYLSVQTVSRQSLNL